MSSRPILGVASALMLFAQAAPPRTLSQTLAQLQSDVPATRIEAFGHLLHLIDLSADVRAQLDELSRKYPADANRIVPALIRSLALENIREHNGRRVPSRKRTPSTTRS